jgi:SAM-dependent methyltransferase
MFWEAGRHLLKVIMARVGGRVDPSDDVVEIGCGVGRVTRWLAREAATVRALDVSAEMLERARELNPGLDSVTWLLGDGESLAPVEDRSADLVFSDVVFQHIPEPAVQLGYVREIGRVLRPGGRAAFQVSDDPALHARRALRDQLRSRAAALLGRGPRGQSHPAWLGAAMDLDELDRVAGESGMSLERVAGRRTQHCHVLLRAAG